ncbi:sugar transferase [uncultured Clostridium sp.]|uniref:sugar transferase n=1 Tax=uncultured Clostridium sp. TaxID=59620 RepID=UPI002605852A|nr:sugar transferase [uncultured Clostridium sp.]
MKHKIKGIDGSLNAEVSGGYLLFKRVVDLIIAIAGLVITLPIIAITCAIVRLESKGNPIYKQKRVGLNNKEFNIYKIRSMVSNAESKGAQWATKNDARVTSVGKFIRKTRIDELPQFFNILKGDMTIIGPRPEREIFYKEFEKDIPNFRDRLLIKPGLTGYAQVHGGYDVMPKEKLDLDIYYIENVNLGLDIKIILQTACIVVTGSGAR